MPRKSITPRTRFLVLKRDGFTCQYCGRKPPEVALHVDHIEPVARGGEDSLDNYVTSCGPCNLGKSTTGVVDATRCAMCGDARAGMSMLIHDPAWKHGDPVHNSFVCNFCITQSVWIVSRIIGEVDVFCCVCGVVVPREVSGKIDPSYFISGEWSGLCAVHDEEMRISIRGWDEGL